MTTMPKIRSEISSQAAERLPLHKLFEPGKVWSVEAVGQSRELLDP